MTDETILADEQDLGERLREYRGQGIVSWIGKLIFGAAFGLGSLALIGWAIYSLVRGLGNLADDGAFGVFFMPGIYCFMGAAMLPFGAWLLLSVYNSMGLSIQAHAEGFTITRRNKTDVFHWEDIAEYTIAPYSLGSARTGQTHYLSYHVKRKDGLKVVLDQANLPGTPEFGPRLVAQVSERLLPAAVEAFERGEQLTFGEQQSEFTVSKEGIRNKKGLLGWAEVAGITLDIRGNKLHIMRRGAPGKRDRPWARLLLSAVPNATVFVKLVEHIRSRPK